MRIVRIFFAVLGLILLLWTAIDFVPLVLQIAGTPVEGRVTGKEVKFHGSPEQADTGVLTVHYEFEADGKPMKSDASVTRSVYESLETGQAIRVKYFRPAPSVNFPDGHLGQGIRGLPLLIAGLACFGVCFWLAKRFD